MSANSPVIIIGMHRSGTSMITQLLQRLRLFMGQRKDPHDESLFFQRINNWMLAQAGASWNHPAQIENLFVNSDARKLTVDYVRQLLRRPYTVNYLGWKRFMQFGVPQRLSQPWGWKDPRNTFTLPIWLDLFPAARVVHIYRHGVDVADSLRQRENMVLLTARRQQFRYRRFHPHRMTIGRSQLICAPECSFVQQGFGLWKTYVTQARKHVEALRGQAYELRFEDFVMRPAAHLRSLAEFCQLDVSGVDIPHLVGDVRSARAEAFRANPELAAFATSVSDDLETFGYPVRQGANDEQAPSNAA